MCDASEAEKAPEPEGGSADWRWRMRDLFDIQIIEEAQLKQDLFN